MIYYVYRSLSKQKTGKGKISFATFQHFNIFASGSGPFFNYYMVPFQIIIYKKDCESSNYAFFFDLDSICLLFFVPYFPSN